MGFQSASSSNSLKKKGHVTRHLNHNLGQSLTLQLNFFIYSNFHERSELKKKQKINKALEDKFEGFVESSKLSE